MTREDVQKAAALIFNKNATAPSACCQYTAAPRRLRPRRPSHEPPPAALAAAALLFASGASAADAEAVGVKMPAHQRLVLPNGLTIILLPKKDVPLIAFSGFVRGGSLADPGGKAGVASLVAGLLDRGAGKRTAFEFADAVEGVGGSFNASAGAEAISVNGQFLARDRVLMIELLADALMRPRFEADEFAKFRDRDIEFIKSAKDSDPSQLLAVYGRAMLFGTHPYGRPQGGSERSLAAITQSDVAGYHAANFGADRATLVFAGDLDARWMKQALTAAFGQWAKSKAPKSELAAAPRATGRRVLLVDSPGSVQTYFWLGNVGVDRRYGGRPALDLVNTLYGGRLHLHPQYRAAHQVGPVVRRLVRFRAWHRRRGVRDPFVHADRQHRPRRWISRCRRSRSSNTTRSSPSCWNPRAPTCWASIRCASKPRPTGPPRSPTSSSMASARTTSKVMVRRSPRWTWPRRPP